MSKVVFWLVVVFAILLAVRLFNAAKTRKRSDPGRTQTSPRAIEQTVRCSRCGVYLPEAEARPGPAGLTCGDPDCARRR